MKHIIVILLFAMSASASAQEVAKPVRVFILAGQSNMEGAGLIKADPKRNGGQGSLEFLVKDAATAKRFAPLVDSAGQWCTRDDVWISYLDRKKPLTDSTYSVFHGRQRGAEGGLSPEMSGGALLPGHKL